MHGQDHAGRNQNRHTCHQPCSHCRSHRPRIPYPRVHDHRCDNAARDTHRLTGHNSKRRPHVIATDHDRDTVSTVQHRQPHREVQVQSGSDDKKQDGERDHRFTVPPHAGRPTRSNRPSTRHPVNKPKTHPNRSGTSSLSDRACDVSDRRATDEPGNGHLCRGLRLDLACCRGETCTDNVSVHDVNVELVQRK